MSKIKNAGRPATSNWRNKSAQLRSTRTPESESREAFIGHSCDTFRHRGAYSISNFGQSNSYETKTMAAQSGRHVQLVAITELLKQPFGDGNIVIHTTDETLMAQLGGESLWRWKENDWWGSNGEPLKHPDLLSQIADEMNGRSVEFACDPYAQMQKAAQAEANAALREWRDSNPGGARRW